MSSAKGFLKARESKGVDLRAEVSPCPVHYNGSMLQGNMFFSQPFVLP